MQVRRADRCDCTPVIAGLRRILSMVRGPELDRREAVHTVGPTMGRYRPVATLRHVGLAGEKRWLFPRFQYSAGSPDPPLNLEIAHRCGF